MDLSVIIVNHNTLSLTKRCIDSLYAHTRNIRFEVIVVDNASIDRSVEMLRSDGRIMLLTMSRNVGFAAANNHALMYALGRNILFLNPDTLLLNNATEQMSHTLDQQASVVACGANIYDEMLHPALSFKQQFPSIYSEIDGLFLDIGQRVRYGRERYFNHSRHLRSVRYVTGADLMVKRKALETVGGFSEEFFLYYEDTDLCQRLATIGEIVSVPTAHIQHLEGASFGMQQIKRRRLIYAEHGREIYYRRHHSTRHHTMANYIYRYRLLLRATLFALLGQKIRSKEALFRAEVVKRLHKETTR